MVPYDDNIELRFTLGQADLQAQNIVGVVDLAHQLADSWGIERAQGKIGLDFEGLPSIPYWTIHEVRAFFARLDIEASWILYFLSATDFTVRLYLRTLLPDSFFDVEVSDQTRERTLPFFKARVYQIVEYCKEAGLDQQSPMVIQAVSDLFSSGSWILDASQVKSVIATSCSE
jgi:hypothetical protein